MNFVKLLTTPFLTEHLWWLLLKTKGNKIKGNLCFLCSAILINELKMLQNSQLTFLKVVTLFLIGNVFSNRVRVIHVKIKYSFVAKSPVISPSRNPP